MSAQDTDTTTPNSTGSLFGDAIKHISTLVRGEVDLARAEVDQNLRRAAGALGMLVGAVVISLTALNVLSAAVVSGLTEAGMDAGWAAFLVGLVLGAIAAGLIYKGSNDLKLSSLAPSRTAENIKRDTRALTGGTEHV
ncbi:phage holin family protein [Poseidonocella sedimentorum]|uniref:Putative Holin-X, holin superfamily III n=1 Tax=Poseidonocella sedimentorum TaxID=871652 RepID=A0A1I6E1C8_9RHOB|nr:phage holin family protein [Poseidonocella sedimentorum]SFR11427.1 Putative Holin-X, holin superfamily III [Poseidonocella sedimentorum]